MPKINTIVTGCGVPGVVMGKILKRQKVSHILIAGKFLKSKKITHILLDHGFRRGRVPVLYAYPPKDISVPKEKLNG